MPAVLLPRSRAIVVATIAAALLSTSVGRCELPEYNVGLGRERQNVMAALRAQAIPAGYQPTFEKYVTDFVLAPFHSQAGSVGKVRKELYVHFQTGKAGPPHALMRELTQKYMIEVLTTAGVDQAVKYQAMLIIGELNKHEADGGAPAKPSPQSLSVMIAAARSSRLKDVYKVAALIGLRRHAEAHSTYPLEAGTRSNLIDVMLDTAGQKQPPNGRSAEGHAWIRRSAIEIIASLGEPGAKLAKFAGVLADIVPDDTADLGLRCAAAESLGKLAALKGTNVDVRAVTFGLGRIAHQATTGEIDRLSQIAPAPAATTATPPTSVSLSGRQLKHRLGCVHAGLVGHDGKGGIAAAAAGSPQQSLAASIAAWTQQVLTVLDQQSSADQLRVQLAAKRAELEKLLGPAESPKNATAGTSG